MWAAIEMLFENTDEEDGEYHWSRQLVADFVRSYEHTGV